MTDPNISDPCISINKGPAGYAWMSPDIKLNGTLFNNYSSGLTADTASTNQLSYIDVNVHASCAVNTSIQVDLWVANPGLAFIPGNGAIQILAAGSSKLIPRSQIPVPGFSALSQTANPSPAGNAYTWQPDSTDPTHTGAGGHVCLVAICYPADGTAPDPNQFHIWDDNHYAQRNIHIVVTMMREEPWPLIRFPIQTGNANRAAAEPAKLRVEADIDPDPRVIDILAPDLSAIPGYKRVAMRTPQSFKFQLPDFPNAVIRDHTRWGCLGFVFWILSFFGIKFNFRPSYEADVQLNPGQVTTLNFEGNLSGSSPGDAHIFHITHARSDGQVIGGSTLVAVVV
jgi:hypothetical protein